MKNLKYFVNELIVTYIKHDLNVYCININIIDLKVKIATRKLILPNIPEDFINQMTSDKIDFDFHVNGHKALFEIDIFNMKAKVFENFHHFNRDFDFVFNV